MALDDPDLPTQGILPSPEELKDCLAVTIRQPRPDLDSSLLLPDGWYQQPAPSDRIDFSKEAEFAPMAVFTATKNFLPEWLERQCYLQQLAIEKMKFNKFPFGWAVDASALQASDLGKLKSRITMFEDGGRLFALTGTAPLEIWDAWVVPLSLCLCTFELLDPKGQSAPLGPKYSEEDPNST
jgi:hypothetical protein